eukprot:gnl/TRDRNA2_/TRDRNA2_174979_c6_seq2.p1 gnl/TRDRNA2_/TRDRNA2_174979_c6~~gnl/TRDRNA2_/TRDRNA2_174979_c6_seq2.p1  ORF type:complete len:277 (+),score=51.14 gnl/TRDRNA2_/TRDRNA2_174979_c6_seq2:66-833(+)
MGEAQSQQKAKEEASFTAKKVLTVDRAHKGYYAKTNLDGYRGMRTNKGIASKMLDKDLLIAISDSLKDDGKISVEETKSTILPKIADGRAGRGSEFTCNERWTVRYALSEFAWDEGSREVIHEALKTMNINDVHDNVITDPEEKRKVCYGPDLAELGEPPEKRAKGARENFIEVDGMMLDRGMLRAVKQGVEDDGVVDALEAVKIFNEGADDGAFTRTERWTLRFILCAYTFTDAAFNFLVEALSKIPHTDEQEA